MYKCLLIYLLLLVACQSEPVTNHNVFPNSMPTPKPYSTSQVYCIDNKVEYIRVEFDGINYLAYDTLGNMITYPKTSKVELTSCQK